MLTKNDPLEHQNTHFAEISRGSLLPKKFTTTGLIHHLRAQHPEEHSELNYTSVLVKKKTFWSITTLSAG